MQNLGLDVVGELLLRTNDESATAEEKSRITQALAPFVDTNRQPDPDVCDFFIKHCRTRPRAILVQAYTECIRRILKINTDFAKFPRSRTLLQEYVVALCTTSGLTVEETMKNFAHNMHGSASSCPFPRILPNLISVCLSGVYSTYEYKKNALKSAADANVNMADVDGECERRVAVFASLLNEIATYSDWKSTLAAILQPIPFPPEAVRDPLFMRAVKGTVMAVSGDSSCDTHNKVLGIREGKDGWFHLYCPGGVACDDDGELFSVMLGSLFRCCCNNRRFLQSLLKYISSLMLLALRENDSVIRVLCGMIENNLIENEELKQHIITSLLATATGQKVYQHLLDKMSQQKKAEQSGGPKKLSLPAKSTDSDLSRILSSGEFAGLECLSLAFTNVTSASARELIRLKNLRYLNLWSTHFGDPGVELIAEHLHKLQVLNLCETKVTDRGAAALMHMKSLKKLNLNSTKLSSSTFGKLKKALPGLQEIDVRYTEVW